MAEVYRARDTKLDRDVEAGIRTLKMCFSNTVMGHDFWSQAFESLAVTPLALSTGIPVSLQD